MRAFVSVHGAAATVIVAVLMFAQLLCATAAALLCLWGAQRLVVLASAMRASRKRPRRAALPTATAPATKVTVQVPLYNEPRVGVRAVDAACALRWPDLEVQILDDSNDETPALVAAAVARHRARGVDVVHVRRGTRVAYKAGALQYGLARSRGELVAVFDADFVPAADFLERVVPALLESGADMAQARWGHLNRDASWLTRAQAALLDAHFAVEQRGRAAMGRFFGFNGTAGVWRKSTIERAGGWDGRTLTEDLDLSLRAWLAGSRFLYLNDVVVPAELPTTMSALRVQQHRWAKGAMQTARLRLPDVLAASRRLSEKIDVTLKLTQNFSFILVSLIVLSLPVAVLERALGDAPFAGLELVAATLGLLPAFASVAWALWRCGRAPLRSFADAILGLGLATALSAHAAVAALAGTLALGSNAFQRTPKNGGLATARTRVRVHALVLLELASGALHLAAATALFGAGLAVRTPFLLLCGGALLLVAARTLSEAVDGYFSTDNALSSAHSQNEPW